MKLDDFRHAARAGPAGTAGILPGTGHPHRSPRRRNSRPGCWPPSSRPGNGSRPPTTRRGPRGSGRRRKARRWRPSSPPCWRRCRCCPTSGATTLPGLLDAVLEGIAVRSRRALRGRDGGGASARVHLGPAGSAAADGGRDRARRAGGGRLAARDRARALAVAGRCAPRVGPALAGGGGRPGAHDFVSAACAAPRVVLSCPRRRDGAPAVPARWLTRLDAFLAGQDMALPEHPAAAWAAALDQPEGEARPVTPPRPCPPVALRPRKLSVTEIETWLRDPVCDLRPPRAEAARARPARPGHRRRRLRLPRA